MERIISLDVKKLLSMSGKRWGFEKYEKIMKTFLLTDVSVDRDFQKTYNGFYGINSAHRSEEWKQTYYSLLEDCKGKRVVFEELIRELYDKTGRVEASFVSKLLHTIDNKMPIWDKFVLRNLNKKMPIGIGEQKIVKCVALYREIVDWYQTALDNEKVREKLLEFDKALPQYAWFTPTKKIDFLLWQMRGVDE